MNIHAFSFWLVKWVYLLNVYLLNVYPLWLNHPLLFPDADMNLDDPIVLWWVAFVSILEE